MPPFDEPNGTKRIISQEHLEGHEDSVTIAAVTVIDIRISTIINSTNTSTGNIASSSNTGTTATTAVIAITSILNTSPLM